MNGGTLWLLLLGPLLGSVASLACPAPGTVLTLIVAGAVAMAALAAPVVSAAVAGQPIQAAGGWLFLDPLSAYHLGVLLMVFLLGSVHARGYFSDEHELSHFPLRTARRFGALWFGALAAMVLVLLSNNLGIMWVGIEASTLLTAFLICLHNTRTSLEATWKYLLMCSVGVAFAFMGTLLVASSAVESGTTGAHALAWTRLRDVAGSLDPLPLQLGFLFLLVGYGTKAGLAPMHNWLPDAHSQAPSPVSALFSGFLLNGALYCILRYLPIVEAAPGLHGFGTSLLVFFGLVSILVAAAFIVHQEDCKRLLAYSSVEHLGIIALGAGLGPAGAAAGLFHLLNHSMAKSLAFFSAGRLGQMYGTHDLSRMKGVLRASPLWGTGLFAGLLALIGLAPFSIFISEFRIVQAAIDTRRLWTVVLFLVGTSIVFAGALRHAMAMAWEEPPRLPAPRPGSPLDLALVVTILTALLVLGLVMPASLRAAIDAAVRVLQGGV